ncbi:MAG: hypothetical protein GX673_10340 [Gammaproteobacteria bacterium]|nr:hypothetical protein [Gammaproteobacteria bacterium]
MKHDPLSSSALLDLVGLIYESINEDSPWYSFADSLRKILGAKAVSVTLHHSPDVLHDIHVLAAGSDNQVDWLDAEITYRERFSHIELLQPKRVAPGQILYIDASMVDSACADYFSALGIQGSLRTCFSETASDMRCWIDIVLDTTTATTDFIQHACALLKQLLPHLSRALGLYAKLQQQETQRDIYEASLDHLALGCVMLDSQAQVLCSNQAANDMIEQYAGLTVTQQRLTLQDKNTQHELNQAVSHALKQRTKTSSTDDERLIRVRLTDGMVLGLLVTPAPLISHYQGKRAPHVIIYLTQLGVGRNSTTSDEYSSAGVSVARLFDLTPQEGKLALLLAAGHTISEASEQLGVAVSAARNYSKSIYAKLDIRGQHDLVRLVSKSFALLR